MRHQSYKFCRISFWRHSVYGIHIIYRVLQVNTTRFSDREGCKAEFTYSWHVTYIARNNTNRARLRHAVKHRCKKTLREEILEKC